MSRNRIGVIGCGAIAQVQHLPNLTELRELFEVTWVCDISPGASAYAAEAFHVPSHTTNYHDLVSADDVDAVILCHTDPKTEVAVAALSAGKHVFIEKPMCFSIQEADAIVDAADRAGKVAQVGYMKVYDPAFELAKSEVDRMDDVRFVQVNHLHPNNALHMRQFTIKRFDDLPIAAVEKTQEGRRKALRGAIGEVPDEVDRAFFTLSGSMIHDLYGLRVMFGVPRNVVSTEVWNEGRAISTVLEYKTGARCVASWVDLPDLWNFKETLEVYGDSRRVVLSYPTGFARGILSTLTLYETDDSGTTSQRRPAIDWESPFARELRHFHACIEDGSACRTPASEARDDISLIIDITHTYLGSQAG